MIRRLYSWLFLILNSASFILLVFGTGITGLIFPLLAVNLVYGIVILYSQTVFRRKLKAMAGIESTVVKNQSLYQELAKAFKNQQGIVEEVKYAIESIAEIGQDDYADRVGQIQNKQVRESLFQAHHKINSLRTKDEEARWVTSGVALIADLKNKENNISLYAEQVISNLVKYIKANQGSFFVLRDEPHDPHFELLAAYAYGKRKFLEKRINVGEGLLGQLYYQREIIYMTDVPKDYVKITSGLGEALPRSICIIPLMNEGRIYGGMEIASFDVFPPHELEFLRKISESIGFSLYALDNQFQTQKLLLESQKMTQELKSQEEELRQNMEELTATQEQMKRKEKEMDAVLSSVSTVELDLDGNVTQINTIFNGIAGYKSEDIVGRKYKSLIPQNGNDLVQYEIMWGNIVEGRSFSGEFRIMNSLQHEMWMAGSFTPILDATGKPYKVMVISLFTTQDKEKLQELQAMVTAFKTIFPIADISPEFNFRGANDLFLKEIGIKRLHLKNTLPSQIMSEISFSRLKDVTIQSKEITEDLELDIVPVEGARRTYQSALIKVNGAAKKSVLIFKSRK